MIPLLTSGNIKKAEKHSSRNILIEKIMTANQNDSCNDKNNSCRNIRRYEEAGNNDDEMKMQEKIRCHLQKFGSFIFL